MPDRYRRVVVAIDCSEDSRRVLARAASIAGNGDSELHIVHVIEPLALAYGADVPMDVSELQNSLLAQARDNAKTFATEFGIPEQRIHVELGSIEKTIRQLADRIPADLIVVGSHTRSGLALLLGSTARGLVPGAHCDVLAVKVDQQESA